MSRGGCEGSVRTEGVELQVEGFARGGAGTDELVALAVEHIGQVVIRLLAVLDDIAVLVELVVVLAVPLAGDVPGVPACRHVVPLAVHSVLRLVAIHVLAHETGLVSRPLQVGADRRVLHAVFEERA